MSLKCHPMYGLFSLCAACCLLAGLGCQRQEAKQANDSSTPARKTPSKTVDRPEVASRPSEPPVLLPEQDLKGGWITLFDGQTLFGLQTAEAPAWSVDSQSKSIVFNGDGPSILRTSTPFANYVLRLEFRQGDAFEGGILLNADSQSADASEDVYEVTISSDPKSSPTGSLRGRKNASRAPKSPVGQDWQSLEVRVDQGHIVVKCGGSQVVDYMAPQPIPRGAIGVRAKSGKIALRNLHLKPLGLTSLFNGRDLSGWKTYPEMSCVFSVTQDGLLNVKNVAGGSGQLETEKSFGDFILQLECITHAPNLNSGVFFRCLPGEKMNGYESQINNGFRDGDRTQPVDCGTGGIFRRQDARRVVADDQKWFYKTLVADGPHVAVWVNGYQVTDWVDTRKPHANPRKGLRLEPGTIMLQGHDPPPDVSFRNLRAAELPKRSIPE